MVLEALTPGAGATGNTTAKISLLQGTKLSKIIAKHGPKQPSNTSKATARARTG